MFWGKKYEKEYFLHISFGTGKVSTKTHTPTQNIAIIF